MKKKILTVLALAGFMTLGVCTQSYAQTDAFVVKDNTKNVVYQFDKDELVDSFLSAKNGDDAALYNEYMKIFSPNGLYAFHDDTKKYIAYSEVEDAFLDCKTKGIGFDINDYTENKGKAMTNMPQKLTKVSAPNGKIVYTEIESGSSSSEETGDLEVTSIE